ncbi:MAG: ATP-grasp domain-containing protein [Planctomycetota bacterium]|nr:ATP-grasp domain-containing protein [Planctomycetota bacterium]
MKIAVVRNRENKGVIGSFGRPCPEVYGKQSVQRVIDALREGGHQVGVFEGDMTMLPALQEYLRPQETGLPGGMVFNMAYGVQGDCRYTHVPAMLEMAGIPYTGSSPLGHTLALDKVITKILAIEAGVPTPAFAVLKGPGGDVSKLRFPLVVKPRHESSSFGLRLVNTREELDEAVVAIVERYQQEALVEEYIAGREVACGIMGNAPGNCLPLVEIDFSDRQHLALMTHADKLHKSQDEPMRLCPAPVDEALAERIREISLKTFAACHCRDYARVDIRVDANGQPLMLEINSMASLGWGGAYVMSARQAGMSFSELVCGIVDDAHRRYFGTPAARSTCDAACENDSAMIA